MSENGCEENERGEEKRVIWEGVAGARFREGGHRWPFHVRMKRSQWKELGVQHSGTMNGKSKGLGDGPDSWHPGEEGSWVWGTGRESRAARVSHGGEGSGRRCVDHLGGMAAAEDSFPVLFPLTQEA